MPTTDEALHAALHMLDSYAAALAASGLPDDAAMIGSVADDLRAELLTEGEAHALAPRETHSAGPDALRIAGFALRWDSIALGARGPTKFNRFAFGKTALRRPLLAFHRDDQPIGVVTVTPDAVGLRIEGQVANTVAGRDLVATVKLGSPSGLSIGFDAIKTHAGPNNVRVVDEAKLHEVSIVSFPADRDARIEAVDGAPVPQFHAAAPFERASRAHRLADGEALLQRAERYLNGDPEDDDDELELPMARDLAGRPTNTRSAREGLAYYRLAEAHRRAATAHSMGVSAAEYEAMRLAAAARALGHLR